MLLQLVNINKSFKIDKYESFLALNNVNLGFKRGEFVSILGPSGCGKSTLLNIIAGLDMPSSGQLIIDGNSTEKYKEKNWDFYRKNNIGFVFQQFNLIEHLSAIENVELVMTLTGIKKAERRKRAYELLERVGISREHAYHLPSQLSGGQKQRVAIARALANDPDIILADEPTGALDTKTGLQVMELLKEVASDKLVIMVTHNQKLAYDYSSRVIRILDGSITSDESIVDTQSDVASSKLLNKKNKSMPFREAIKLSFRNMKQKFGRVLTTAIAGSIGIAGISLVLGLSNGANIFIDNQVVKFGTSNVLTVSKSEKNKDGDIVKVTDSKDFDFIKKNPEVAEIRPELDKLGTWTYNKSSLDTEVGALASPKYQKYLEDFLIGKLPQEGKNELLINKAMARSILNAENSKNNTDYDKVLNKKVKLNLNSSGFPVEKTFKVAGIIDEIDVDQNFLYYNYQDMKDLMQDTKFFGKSIYSLTMKKVENYEVVIKNAKDAKEVKSWIMEKSGSTSSHGGGGGMFSFGNASEGVSVSSFSLIFQQALNTIINIAQLVMIAFLIISMIVSSILIAIVLFSSILERKTEIGILKAVGARKKDIMRVFESEAILLGFFAGVIGVTLSVVLIPIAESIVNSFIEYDISGIIQIPLSGELFGVTIPFLPIIILLFISTFVAFIAGYLPSRRATKMQVIDALRDE